jgi:CMP-N-acetylneuraminic acid synthetase
MEGFINQSCNIGRQNMSTYYYLNGAIYTVRVDSFPKDKYIYDGTCFAYIMPEERSVDIDTALDFMLVETVIKYNKQNKK